MIEASPLDEAISIDSVSSEQILNRYCQSSIIEKFQKRKNSYPKVTLDPRLFNKYRESGKLHMYLVGDELTSPSLQNHNQYHQFIQQQSHYDFPPIILRSNPLELRLRFPTRRSELKVKRHRFRIFVALEEAGNPIVWCLSPAFRLCGKIQQFINTDVVKERRRRHTKRPKNGRESEETSEGTKPENSHDSDDELSSDSSPGSPPRPDSPHSTTSISSTTSLSTLPSESKPPLFQTQSLPSIPVCAPHDHKLLNRSLPEPLSTPFNIRNLLNDESKVPNEEENAPKFNRPVSYSVPTYFPPGSHNGSPFYSASFEGLPLRKFSDNVNQESEWKNRKDQIVSLIRDTPESYRPRLVNLLKDELELLAKSQKITMLNPSENNYVQGFNPHYNPPLRHTSNLHLPLPLPNNLNTNTYPNFSKNIFERPRAFAIDALPSASKRKFDNS